MRKRPEARPGTSESNEALLKLMIETTVPIYIMEYAERGGVQRWDLEWLKQQSEIIASEADVLFRYQKGKTAEIFNVLCKCLAIMSFMPGGVKMFGFHFEAGRVLASLNRREP